LVALFEYLGSSRYGDGYSNLNWAFQAWQHLDEGDDEHITESESEWITMISGALRKLLAA
jgi:hypothetical protein